MIDINLVRQKPDWVKQKAAEKGYDIDIERLLKLDEDRRELQKDVDELRARRNKIADDIKNAGGKPEPEKINEGKMLKIELTKREEYLKETEAEFWPLFKSVPNMPLDLVPVGSSEDQNVVIREIGQKPNFEFEPKSHADIAEAKGWLDRDRATKIAGARFVYLKGDLVKLEMALWQFAINVVTDESILRQLIQDNNLNLSNKAFVPIIPPAVAKKEIFEATGRLNREEQTYQFEGEDLWMNASAEHTIAPIYFDEIINEADLPIRYIGYTTAFRKEAGTYGKDGEGFFRLHQFNKLEMESFTTPESSFDEHILLVAIQEYLMTKLGLPYQVLEKCTADIGRPNAKGVDINVWIPTQQTFRETHTADYITDFQARGMQTRLKRADGTIEYLHTNDATAFSQRPLIAIIENFQTADGDVVVPEVLRPFMGGKEKI